MSINELETIEKKVKSNDSVCIFAHVGVPSPSDLGL